MILLLAHAPLYTAGALRSLLLRRALPHRTLRLYLGDPFPDDIRRFKAVVSLGGDLSADDDRRGPFLRDEVSFLRRAVVAGVPLLGIGLGARILARALGGAVGRAPVPERGWSTVSLTPIGRRDPLFAGLGALLPVFCWSDESLGLPPGAELLATSDASPNQAFRFAMSWGVGFHPEIDADLIESWSVGSEEYPELRRTRAERVAASRRRARVLFGNFLGLAECAGRSS